jgi:small conductance mechanosensitive channel
MEYSSVLEQVSSLILQLGQNIILAAAIFIVGRWAAEKVKQFLQARLTAREVDVAVVQFAGNLTYVLVIAFALVAALGQLGVQTASIVAALGAAGLAIGLSLQGSLSNFAAGILIILFKPCRVGDYVDAGGCSGTVSDINLLATTLLTPDNKTVIIPNSSIMGGAITNYSKMPTRRVDLVIGVSYDSDLKKVRQVLSDVVAADDRILPEPEVKIAVHTMADSSVNFVVRPWVNTADYWPVHFALTENIKNAFDEAGISIPFPQMDVHIQRTDETKGR